MPTLVASAPDANPAVSSVARPSGSCRPRQSHAVRTRIVTPIDRGQDLVVGARQHQQADRHPEQRRDRGRDGLAPQDVARATGSRSRSTSGTPTELIATTATFGPNSSVEPGNDDQREAEPGDRLGGRRERDDQRDRDEHRRSRQRTGRASLARPRPRRRAGPRRRTMFDSAPEFVGDAVLVDAVGDPAAFRVVDRAHPATFRPSNHARASAASRPTGVLAGRGVQPIERPRRTTAPRRRVERAPRERVRRPPARSPPRRSRSPLEVSAASPAASRRGREHSLLDVRPQVRRADLVRPSSSARRRLGTRRSSSAHARIHGTTSRSLVAAGAPRADAATRMSGGASVGRRRAQAPPIRRPARARRRSAAAACRVADERRARARSSAPGCDVMPVAVLVAVPVVHEVEPGPVGLLHPQHEVQESARPALDPRRVASAS